MKTPDIGQVVGSLQAVANGQPPQLGQLVAQAVQQLAPDEVRQAAALLPLSFQEGKLRFSPQHLEQAFQQVLGTLSPAALQALQGLTSGNLAALAGPHAQAVGQGMLENVASHLLQEAAPQQLTRFTKMGSEVLVASAGPLDGLLAPPAPAPTTLAAAPATKAQKPKQTKPQPQKEVTATTKARPVQTGRVSAKKLRYEARMKLIKQGEAKNKQAKSKELGSAIARLKKNNVAVERFRLAADAYNYQALRNPSPADFARAKEYGFRILDDQPARNGTPRQVIFQKGTSPEGWVAEKLTHDPVTGLNAVLYRSEFEKGANGKPVYVLAFGGTELHDAGEPKTVSVLNRFNVPNIPKDVWADFTQGGASVFRSRQYDHAAQLARRYYNQYSNLEFTGHSLGGGLATLGGILFDKRTYTFNAAGLHLKTLTRHGIDRNTVSTRADKIFNIHSSGDPLTQLQSGADKVRPWAWDRGDIPSVIGEERTIGTGPHGPGGTGIEEGLEKQKSDDTWTIHQYLAGKKP